VASFSPLADVVGRRIGRRSKGKDRFKYGIPVLMQVKITMRSFLKIVVTGI